jgi:WD40 repeat protein
MDYSIRLWDFEKRQRVATLHGHLNEVLTIALSRDGQSIVSGARGGGVKLWPTRPQPRTEEFAGARVPLAFSTNSAVLAALSRSNTVLFLDLKAGTTLDEFPLETSRGFVGPPAPGAGAVAGPGGSGPGMGGSGFRMMLPMPMLSISADLRTIATAHFDGTVKLLNTSTRESTTLQLSDQAIHTLALSPDGRTLVTGSRESGLGWRDLRRGTNITVESEGGRALFSGDSRTLAVFNRQGSIELWDVASRSLRTNLVVDPAPNLIGSSGFPAAFSPDGTLLAVACQDDSIRLWDMRTMESRGALIGHKQHVYTVAFSPDGKTIATASDDSTLKFWNVATQQELSAIRRLGGGLRALTFSPDGRFLVAGTSSTLITGGLRVFRTPLFEEIESERAPQQ